MNTLHEAGGTSRSEAPQTPVTEGDTTKRMEMMDSSRALQGTEHLDGPIRLSVDNVASYLQGTGLLRPSSIVRGPFRVQDVSSANRNFLISVPGGMDLFVKQVANPQDEVSRERIRREAMVLGAIRREEALAPLRARVPQFVRHDDDPGILILERLQTHQGLDTYSDPREHRAIPPGPATIAGQLAAKFHEIAASALADGALEELPASVPPAIRIVEHVRTQKTTSNPARNEFNDYVRDEAGPICEALEGFTEASMRMPAVIHGDLRWMNIMTGDQARLIDFELASRGDPAWDLVTFLGDYFGVWAAAAARKHVRSLADAFERVPEAARDWRTSATYFWVAYCRQRGLRGDDAHNLLQRVARYLPIQLITLGYTVVGQKNAVAGPSKALVELALRAHDDPAGFMGRWFGEDAREGLL